MARGVLFVMSGPSGTGKGTICERLLANENNNIFLSISSTTRGIRKGEVDGVTYNYTTVENFEKMIADGEMLEYAEYNGNYYGTPRRAVADMLSSGRNVLLEIEVQGALKVKNIFPDAILMFVIPPSMKELKNRLTDRGRESEEQILKRMETAKWEFTKSPLYNHIFINDDLDECVKEVETVMRNESAKRGLVDKLISEQY
ncbi:MAG: guanylate kinase [Clostridia bacterium]|nr:guanylate kinase [Clostridia bacterium]MBQ6557929.1 guanylate kinase [Clostridia bacterium]